MNTLRMTGHAPFPLLLLPPISLVHLGQSRWGETGVHLMGDKQNFLTFVTYKAFASSKLYTKSGLRPP